MPSIRDGVALPFSFPARLFLLLKQYYSPIDTFLMSLAALMLREAINTALGCYYNRYKSHRGYSYVAVFELYELFPVIATRTSAIGQQLQGPLLYHSLLFCHLMPDSSFNTANNTVCRGEFNAWPSVTFKVLFIYRVIRCEEDSHTW